MQRQSTDNVHSADNRETLNSKKDGGSAMLDLQDQSFAILGLMQAYLEQSGQMEHFTKFLEGKQSELIKIRHKSAHQPHSSNSHPNGGAFQDMQKVNRSHSVANAQSEIVT